MSWVDSPQKEMGFTIQKRLGSPNMFGWIIPGWSEFGDDNEYSGVYQQRRPRVGNGKLAPIQFGSQKNFIQRPCWPSQPPSAARDAQQAKFSTALSMWQNLTEDEKRAYNEKASKISKRGYDLFMSITLKSL